MLKYIFVSAIFLSLNSCISSLRQLVTYDKVVTDNRICGNWQMSDNSSVSVVELLKSNFYKSITAVTVENKQTSAGFDSKEDSLLYSKSYIMNFSKAGYNYTMIVSLMQLNNELYADLIPVSGTASSSTTKKQDELFPGPDYYPAHTIAKVVFQNSNMRISFINGEFVKNKLTAGAMAISYEQDNLFNTSLVIASPTELQQFISKYGNDERLYSPENTVILKKI